jgi:CelD/BcsL family acetyltransferase involved in cellulose biosynthesis
VSPSAQPNPSNAYKLALDSCAERTLKRALAKDFRRNLRKKEKYLAALGPVRHRTARSPAEVDSVLDVFFRQKSTRFRAIGLPNDFDAAGVRAFLRQGCLTGIETGHPAIELHALEVGGRIVATFGLAADRAQGSGMFNSIDGTEEIARCSPGDLLIARVIAAQCQSGRAVFDLGVGEARYKRSFCDEIDELFTLVLPVTARGHVYAGAVRRLVASKRLIKQTRWAWGAVGALRVAGAKLNPASGSNSPR